MNKKAMAEGCIFSGIGGSTGAWIGIMATDEPSLIQQIVLLVFAYIFFTGCILFIKENWYGNK